MKNKLISTLFCATLLLSGSAQAMDKSVPLNRKSYLDKMLAKLAQSSWMVKLNQSKAKRTPLPPEEAHPDLQKLGREAQLAVGIPEDKLVPIRLSNDDVYQAGYNYIETPASGRRESYGIERCNMHHESVHVKYNDHTLRQLVVVPIAALAGLLSECFLIKRFNPTGWRKIIYPIFTLSSAPFLIGLPYNIYTKYIERRADIEGHYATQCCMCVNEKVEQLDTELKTANNIMRGIEYAGDFDSYSQQLQESHNFPHKLIQTGVDEAYQTIAKTKNGHYLSIEENRQIAAELKRRNLVCDFQKK